MEENMNVTSKDNVVKEYKLFLLTEEVPTKAEFDKFRQLTEILNDEDLHSFLSDPNLKGKVCQNICHDVLKMICILCAKGYLNSLTFLHEQFHEIGGPELTKSALQAYAGKGDVKHEYSDEQCRTPIPLYSAIHFGQTHVVEYLLTIGTMVDESGMSLPLFQSCERGYLDITKLLIEHGADWKQKDDKDYDCFYIACCRGFTKIVEYLIDLGVRVRGLLDPHSAMGETPLGGACFYSGNLFTFDLEVIDYYPGDHYCPAIPGEKPYPRAEREGSNYPATVRLLLCHGNSQKLLYGFQKTAFMSASEGGSADVLNLLLQYGKAEDVNARSLTEPNHEEKVPLASACLYGNLDAVRFLISRRAIINSGDLSNTSTEPIVQVMSCRAKTRIDILKLLIQHGANVNFSDSLPLEKAIYRSDTEALEVLLAAGVRLTKYRSSELLNDACLCKGCVPYRKAWFNVPEEMDLDNVKKRMEILRMLLEAGLRSECALNNVCEKRCTFFRKPAEMLKILIYYGADVNREMNGNTALITSCYHLDYAKIKVLANCGADVNKPDVAGSTPLQICTSTMYKHQRHCLDNFEDDIIRLLCEKGADVHIVCPNSGCNLLDIVCLNYEKRKLAMLLFYLSQGLSLQPKCLPEMLQAYGIDEGSYTDPNRRAMWKELRSILLIDNAITTCHMMAGPAGRLVLMNLFDCSREQEMYLQPDFDDMLRMLHGASFVIYISDEKEQEFAESNDETRQMTMKIVQEELSRIPSLTELCRWAIRRILGPGLISLQKVDQLPLPKPLIDYILLLDIIDKQHAQIVYNYITDKDSQKMSWPRTDRNLPDPISPLKLLRGICTLCDTDHSETVRLQRLKDREATEKWANDFIEQCQEEDSRNAQENYVHHPEDWKVLDEIQTQ